MNRFKAFLICLLCFLFVPISYAWQCPGSYAMKAMGLLTNNELRERLRSGNLEIQRKDLDNPALLCLLLERGADVHAQDGLKRSTFHSAAIYGGTEAVGILQRYGTDVNIRDSWQNTPLHKAACYNQDPEVTQLLIARGADIHARNQFDQLPIHCIARANKNPEVLRSFFEVIFNSMILSQVHEIDMWGNTPLHYAAKYNTNVGFVEILLENGADVNALNYEAENPVDLACKNPNPDVRDMLMAERKRLYREAKRTSDLH